MRLILSLFIVLLAQIFSSIEIRAQSQAPSCPSITVRDEDGDEVQGIVGFGGLTFTANVAGSIPTDKPTFDWTISGARIIAGQGTATITVVTGENIGQEIIATVEIGGVSGIRVQCDKRPSATIRVGERFCPNLSVSCPTETVWPGTPAGVSVNISGGSPHMNPKYNWQLSAGKITSGRGTPEISVDTSDLDGQTITATVEVDGLRPECPRTVSCQFLVIGCRLPLSTMKFDEYDDLSWKNEGPHLDNFAMQLQQAPDWKGYIIIYGPHRVDQRLARVRNYLVEKRGIDLNRIILVNGGHNKKIRTQFWVVPPGAAPPTPDPNF